MNTIAEELDPNEVAETVIRAGILRPDPRDWCKRNAHMLEVLSPLDIVRAWEEHCARFKSCPTCGGSRMVSAMIQTATGMESCPYLGEPCPDCTAK